jgi:hypothetical protein
MANIKDLIQSIESSDSSFDEKLAAINEMEETLEAMRSQEQEAIDDNVSLIVEAIKVMERKVEAQLEMARAIVPEKGDKGEQGRDGQNGRDGRDGQDGKDGLNGKDGQDGADGVSVTDAKIDFDGSLVITLSSGREINVGEVVAPDLAEKIKLVTSGGGTSQQVLDAIAALQATIATYGTMATQNANAVAITGGTINGATVGATTPAAGTFTTLTATGEAKLGGDATNPSLVAAAVAGSTRWLQVAGSASSNVTLAVQGTGSPSFVFQNRSTGPFSFTTNATLANEQLRVAHTASAVNFVQVTGAATGAFPLISAQGSDGNIHLGLTSKGNSTSFGIRFYTNNGAQEQFRVQHAVSAVNFATVNGSAAGNALQYFAQGTDTNISQVFQSKGTGAINLAPGSSGVNISNGGTVTAITRTANGSYTSMPTAVISAPTTAGGTQATLSPLMSGSTATVVAGGTGYTVGDTLTIVGATGTPSQLTVATLSGSAVATVTFATSGSMSALPTNPVSVTGGTGSGATFTMTYSIAATQSSFTAGSGYVEQPTVTFSGGGGSGAAAYATMGGTPIIKGLGSNLDFYTANVGIGMRLEDTGGVATGYFRVRATTGAAQLLSTSSMSISSTGANNISLLTNGIAAEQLRVAHTASAVNFVQVTGAATGSGPTISAQGSDANAFLAITSKGTSAIRLQTGGTTQVFINNTTNAVNTLNFGGAVAGSAPYVAALGSDTNIDLALTPKGTGNVRFGTFTSSVLTPTGFIEIRDAGGTIRRLLVG